MNVYHTPQYQAYRQECAFVFSEEHRSSLPGKTELLSEGYSVRTDYYTGQGRYQLHAARHRLLDSGGQVVYTWDNINDDGEFYQLIPHANGNHYLIFREDLYGYSVLEVETGETLHYIPENPGLWTAGWGRRPSSGPTWPMTRHQPAGRLGLLLGLSQRDAAAGF